MAYNYYHQSKILLLRSMIGCIALVGCNTHNTRLGMAPTARDHTVSTGIEIDATRASLASHDAPQEVSAIPQEEFIVQKNQLIEAKEQEIAAVHTEISNIALSRDTLIQANEEKRISIKAKQEDTDHMRTWINKISDSYDPRVKCTSCGIHERIPKFIIEEIKQKYDVGYSQWVDETWKWSIFSGSRYARVVSDRKFKHCFRCLNKSDIRQWEREISNNETRLNAIPDSMNAAHSRLDALNSEKEGIASDIAAYTRQINRAAAIEAQRKSEEEARIQAEQACKEKDEKIAALEAQLAMRGGNPYMNEQTANSVLGDGNEATVLINRRNRSNGSEVLSLNVRRVGHNGVQREESDTRTRATHELYEQMAWDTPGDLQHIAYADSDDEDKKMPAIAVQEQTQANRLDTPRSLPAIRHAHPASNYPTNVNDIVCNMIRKNYPTEVICDLTGYTPAQVESLRRDVDFPQEINAPREDDDVTTLTSQGNTSAQFPLAASMEPEELAETELIAFGSSRDASPEEQVATEGEGEQASSHSFTILSSNESLESEL